MRIKIPVTTNPIDPNKDVKPLAAVDSGEKESFLRKHTTLPTERDSSVESWVALCAQAAVEQDPKRLLELVSQINRLLDARRKRLASDEDGQADHRSGR